MIKDFFKEHEDGFVVISTMLLITIMTGLVITATGKTIVVELDGLNATNQDSEGNFEERHVDGGKFKLYAE